MDRPLDARVGGANRRMATPLIAAVRAGGDRTTVEDRQRQPGRRIVQDDHGADRRQAERRRSPGSRRPTSGPSRSSSPSGSSAAEVGRHRVTERRRRAGMDADLGRQLGRAVGERDERPLGEMEPLVERRQRGDDVGPRQVAAAGAWSPAQSRVRAGPGSSLPSGAMATIDTAQSLDNLKLERDAIVLYDALAEIERDPRRAPAFRTIAGNERRHAEVWADEAARARRRGAAARAAAGRGSGRSSGSPGCSGPGRSATWSRRSRATRSRATRRRPRRRCWRSPPTSASTPRSGSGCPDGAPTGGPRPEASRAAHAGRARPGVDRSRRALAPGRSVGHPPGGHLRGQRRPRQQHQPGDGRGRRGQRASRGSSCWPGSPGCSPGAFSMAAGEYISMQSQRELYERQIALERAELEAMPDEEQAELAAVYRAKGFTADGGGRDRGAPVRRPGARPRHAHPRGARARSGRARLAVEGGRRLVRRVRRRGGDPGHPVPRSAAGRRSWSLSIVPQPRGDVRGRGRGQPADRPGRDLLRVSARSPSARPRPG